MKTYTTKEIVEGSEDYGSELCETSDDPYSTVAWMQHWNKKYVEVKDIEKYLEHYKNKSSIIHNLLNELK